ncbi:MULTISPECIES: ATPase domain-containing protein [Roseiflexus]|jgi:circadian clock protein KaiC|nr:MULTISPECIES: ATPase domain-containing protein [Roseiflexus]GIV99590.1 MAG: serine/threonine protein kinase [Roseiflexus sp.]
MSTAQSLSDQRLSTGIPGLDEILFGGFLPGRAYLVRGGPGSGKTTLGMHFLSAAAAEEAPLFITLTEPVAQLQKNAERMGIDVRHIRFLDLSPSPQFFTEVETYDIFSPAEVERAPTARKITEMVERLNPQRVFLDAMTQFRYLASDAYQFRQQVLSFLHFLKERGITLLFTSEASPETPDEDLQFMADGIIHLRMASDTRFLEVTKFRGSAFAGGAHTCKLGATGMQVFPRLLPDMKYEQLSTEHISSGVPELDALLHGGIERSTITMLCGPSGVGKTTLGLQFMKEAAGRGERSVVYSFEEEVDIILGRCEAVAIPARSMIAAGTLQILKIEPLQYTADEFARLVRRDVQDHGTRLVMIDSIAGYNLALRGENLEAQLYALSKYLQHHNVTLLLVVESAEITGNFRVTDGHISYLGDTIIFIRYLEIHGEMRKAIGVLKKRLSDFERTLREIEITSQGIKVGGPLSNLRGILSGTPEWISERRDNG